MGEGYAPLWQYFSRLLHDPPPAFVGELAGLLPAVHLANVAPDPPLTEVFQLAQLHLSIEVLGREAPDQLLPHLIDPAQSSHGSDPFQLLREKRETGSRSPVFREAPAARRNRVATSTPSAPIESILELLLTVAMRARPPLSHCRTPLGGGQAVEDDLRRLVGVEPARLRRRRRTRK